MFPVVFFISIFIIYFSWVSWVLHNSSQFGFSVGPYVAHYLYGWSDGLCSIRVTMVRHTTITPHVLIPTLSLGLGLVG